MSTSRFSAPSLEEMNALLPAFEFESELTANEIGAVYYARQVSLDRYVAVKLFSREKGNDDRFLASLKRSSTMVAGLNHPNLIGFIDSGIIDGMPFLVMEFVPGKSLHRSTHGHAIEFKLSMDIIRQVCEGLSHAHHKKVIHGNLSPLNILLNQKAAPKIGNFALGRGIHTLPDVEVAPHFSAPEVLAGETHTVASDVYSLGAILYELITATPYRAGAPRASELEGSPAPVDKVIEKACHADPAERYQSAMEFLKALEKAAANKQPKRVAAPSPNVAAPARSKAMDMAMSTSGAGIAVKAVVIVVLLIAIMQVHSYRKSVVEKRKQQASAGVTVVKKEVTSFEMTRQQRQQQIAQQRQEAAQQQAVVTEFPDEPETPMESLERLGNKLSGGDFSELPIGTVTKGGRHYFFVEQSKTWPEALAHALELGASIAQPDSVSEWSAEEAFKGRAAWLGAALSGPGEYTMLDGKPWQPASEPSGGGPYVHIDGQGAFATASANTRLPYLMRWAADGSEPPTLETQLAATAASLKSGDPVYPPGAFDVGERRYLAVSRSVNWEQAAALAKSAGGNLLVLSDDKEKFELTNWSGRLAAGSTYWLGGKLQGESWQWTTAEPWSAIEWSSMSNAAADDAAMILRAGSGLDASASTGNADGFIIEWSKDAETNKAQPGQETESMDTPSELTDMAKQLVTKAIADKEAAHVKNTAKLAWDLDAHVRGLKRSDQVVLAPEAEKLKACVQDNRLLKETIEGSGARMNPFMAKLCNYIMRKQFEIDEQHAKSLEVIHASYLKKLGEIRDQAKARGQVKAQLSAEELIDASQGLDAWVARMSQ